MFKKNKILVGCLALLLVLSVGYALFSETITINGTATAKGNFDMTATCQSGYSEELVNAGIKGSKDEGQTGFNNDSCSVSSGNKVSFQTGFDAPGAKREFTVKVTNTGTIDAMLDKSKSLVDHGVTNLVTKVCPILENGEASTDCTRTLNYTTHNGFGTSQTDIYEYELIAFETDGVVCSFDDSCITNYVTADEDLILESGSSAYYTVGFFWPDDYVSGYDNGFKATASMEIPFIQVTAQ